MKSNHPVLSLKPTQFALGMLEIDEKIKDFQKMSKNKLKKYLRDNPIPVVVSPHKELYLTDHHHLLYVCFQIGVAKVKVKVVEDLSDKKMAFIEFWRWMRKHNYFYPYCQFGEGPRSALYLPNDIRGMADDPYRSFAWFVKKAGGYDGTDMNFSEFKWANFFRKKKLLERHGKRGIEAALKKGIKLARSREACRLPGFLKK